MKLPITLYHAAKRHRAAEIRHITSGPLATAVLDLCTVKRHTHWRLTHTLYQKQYVWFLSHMQFESTQCDER